MKKILLLCFAISIISCKESKSQDHELAPAGKWEFNNLDGWKTYSQDDNPDQQITLKDGIMTIMTRANSKDRKKAATIEKIYTTGNYKWRTWIPMPDVGDNGSVGSWIYCNDQHEIDFEVGYGKAEERKKYGATDGTVLAYMTTQAHPFMSKAVPIKPGWHIFEINLSLVDGNYFVKWSIDGELCATVQQTFGPEWKFSIYCSAENLNFMGDHAPTKDNIGMFDWVEYTPHQ